MLFCVSSAVVMAAVGQCLRDRRAVLASFLLRLCRGKSDIA